MLQAFMVVLREGVEAFLIVAIIIAYLRRTAQHHLLGTVRWGIFASVLTSALLGYLLWVYEGANQPLWEGVFALVTVALVASFVIHMWRMGPELKRRMEEKLSLEAAKANRFSAHLGVFLFSVVMISREGMETVLLLFQIHEPRIVSGAVLGIFAAAGIGFIWQQFGYRIPFKRFFQITSLFLLLFILQIGVQGFHEFTETGMLPASEWLHELSEPYSMEGVYGRWYSNAVFVGCFLWLMMSFLLERNRLPKPSLAVGVGVENG